MNFKVLIYIFWKKICFHCRRHPYIAIWTVIWLVGGLEDLFVKGISDYLACVFIGVVPWFAHRAYRAFNGHSVRDAVERERNFEKYINDDLKRS